VGTANDDAVGFPEKNGNVPDNGGRADSANASALPRLGEQGSVASLIDGLSGYK